MGLYLMDHVLNFTFKLSNENFYFFEFCVTIMKVLESNYFIIFILTVILSKLKLKKWITKIKFLNFRDVIKIFLIFLLINALLKYEEQ